MPASSVSTAPTTPTDSVKQLMDLCARVRLMRRAQDTYFKQRSAYALRHSIHLERELDAELDRIEREHKEGPR